MKLINYRCNNPECRYEEEELFQDAQEAPNMLDHYCPMCSGILYKFNFKNNGQIWKFNDTR